MTELDINFIALGLSIVICSMLGAVWYSPKGFGTKWLQAQGKTMDELGSPVPPLIVQLFATAFICLTVGYIDMLYRHALLPSGMHAVFCAALLLQTWAARLWLGFNRTVAIIDTGYVAVLLAVPSLAFCFITF